MKAVSTLAVTLMACLTGAMQPGSGDAGQPGPKPGQGGQPGKLPAGHPGLINSDTTQSWPKARPDDVSSIDAIMSAMYKVPAGNPGEARDWDRFRSLFTPDARIIPARGNAEGGAMAMYVTVTDYVALNRNYFEKGGFTDTELARRVESFGNMAQVWSTFASRRNSADAEPYARGINSVQLLKDGNRWWIVNVFYDIETPGTLIPDEYLKNAEK